MLKLITCPNPIGLCLMLTIAKRNLDAIAAAKTEGKGEAKNLANLEADLRMNTHKQGWVLTTALLLGGWYVHDVGSAAVLSNSLLWNVASGLTVAWFVITFSSVKKMFLDSATVLTYLMFTAFTLPWIAVSIAILFSPEIPWSEKAFICVPIMFAWVAAAIYDSLDLLRGNMDELAMEFFTRGTRGRLPVEVSGGEE